MPPELLFGGLRVGGLFVPRNAGNMADTATMGTIEHGVEHLGVPLVVVMGHEIPTTIPHCFGKRDPPPAGAVNHPEGCQALA